MHEAPSPPVRTLSTLKPEELVSEDLSFATESELAAVAVVSVSLANAAPPKASATVKNRSEVCMCFTSA